ncbi:MAG: Smr/MutS family protein [Methyloceanibacter sp.]
MRYAFPMGKRDTDRDADAELWARVAGTAAPLRKKNRVAQIAPRRAPPKPAPKTTGASARPAKPSAKPLPSPASGALDRLTARKLDRGHLAVDGRLDLHGMRQRDAHAALRKFVKWAVAKDLRHVLVITGKGAARDEGKSFHHEGGRGVLRQAVPHWLSQPDLAPLIVSFAPAPRRLGGEGALYVRLRRKG